MSDIITFASREAFREWLSAHCLSSDGVWLLFGKSGGPNTIKAIKSILPSAERKASGRKRTRHWPTALKHRGL